MVEYTPCGAPCANTWEEEMARHEALVRWVVRRQWLGPLPFPDACQEGRIGLWHALARYDPRRGTAFSTYAVPAIAHAVWRAVAAAQREGRREPLALGDAEREDPGACAEPWMEPLDLPPLRGLLDALLAQLSPRSRQALVAHYGLDGQPAQSFTEIGRAWGVSRQRVQQLHRKALVDLAHPAHSRTLRRFLGYTSRQDYRLALERLRRQARARRHLRGGP